MKYLLTGVAAITMLTACGQKDKPVDAGSKSGIVFSEEKVPGFKVHSGDAATAPAAVMCRRRFSTKMPCWGWAALG